MLTHNDIFAFLDGTFPFSSQLGFDNAGFLVGDKECELSKAVVALDVTESVIDYAISQGANLIISHHPVIFDLLKAVTADSIVFKLIKNGISVISAHTNLDMSQGGVNDMLCDVIGLNEVDGVLPEGEVFAARVGKLDPPLTPDELGFVLKEALGGCVKYCDAEKEISTVGVCSGSGGSMLCDMAQLKVDAFVTADVKHNVFFDAKRLGVSIYDCGHFETENVVVKPLARLLNENFGNKFLPYTESEIKFC